MPSGIYRIVNWVNGKTYVGSATYLRKRLSEHKRTLILNKHNNKYLQNSWNKYGETNFCFEILEYCIKDILIIREQYWINKLNSVVPKGYNLAPIAGNTAGIKWTEEVRAKQIAVRTGKKRSQDEKDKISLGMIGIKNRLGTRQTEITRIRMRNAKANKTQEMSDNQSAAQRKLDKWPCVLGCRCKCESCNSKRLNFARQYRQNIK